MALRTCLTRSFSLGSFLIASAAAAQGQPTDPTPPPTPLASEATDNIELGDIIVTAQKRAENVQRIPIAVSTVGSAELAAGAVFSMRDLGRAIPTLKLLDIGGQITPRIRGIGATSANPGVEAPVATFVDGIYYASTADVAADLSDVVQISVLKGPQGTLFGRNATGGVIQLTTRDPKEHFEASLGTGIDNYATWRSDAFVGGPIAEDVRASLSAQYVKQYDGWGVNIFSGQDVHRIDGNYQFRGKLIWDPQPSTTVRLSGDYAKRKGSIGGVYRTPPGFPQALFSPLPVREWSINSYIQPLYDYEGGGGSLTIEHDLGFGKVTSISAYRKSRVFWQFNPSATAVPALDVDLSDFARQFTQEIQLVSDVGSSFDWAVGAFYFHQSAGQQPLHVNLRAGPIRGPGPFSTIVSNSTQKLDSLAGFAQATVRITEHTRVTAGIRYTWEKKTLDELQFGQLAFNPAVFVPLIPATSVSRSEQRPTWRLSLDQDLAPDVIGYLSYNRGYKSGGFNTRDITNPPFAAETLDAYEAGIKSQFMNNRVRLNAAAFYYDYKNIQVGRYTTTTVIYNGAKSRVYGFDVDLEARPTSEFTISGGLGYLNSKFTDFPVAQSSSYVLVPGGAIITQGNASATGNRLPYSPSLSYTLGLTYRMPVSVGTITGNFSDNYSGRYFVEPDNKISQKPYHLLNASVAWDSPASRYVVRIFANNLLNKAIFVQSASNATGYQADYPIAPFTYGLRLELSF
jgi:iron complex outermembrane recepter protein